jgi:hypothetical protein
MRITTTGRRRAAPAFLVLVAGALLAGAALALGSSQSARLSRRCLDLCPARPRLGDRRDALRDCPTPHRFSVDLHLVA